MTGAKEQSCRKPLKTEDVVKGWRFFVRLILHQAFWGKSGLIEHASQAKGGIKSLNRNLLGFNTYNTVRIKHLSKVAKTL